MHSALYKEKNNKVPCPKLLRTLTCMHYPMCLRTHGVEGAKIKIKNNLFYVILSENFQLYKKK